MVVVPKTKSEIESMRKAGQILQMAQKAMKEAIPEGKSLLELDAIAEQVIRENGGIPAFKGYQGFPATLCTMINSEIVHGIPDNRVPQMGDLVSIDCGVIYNNLHADAAFSLVVGGPEANPERSKFEQTVYRALIAGCKAAKTGNKVSDIGKAIQPVIENAGYSLCKEYTGHGIGEQLWEDPHVFNYPNYDHGDITLKTGMTFAIEPIVAAGKPQNKTLKDGWTVVTVDGKDACQWEHFGVVTPDGLEILA